MKREIEIGRSADGRPVMMDVDLMLRSGLLLQAGSGGGKSWLLRRLAEQLCPIIPVFVVDVEGEFASLREKFPFVLVAKTGGDAVADARIAAQLALQLLELRVSAVFDLFELDISERHVWMRAFLDSMDKAPRDLWGDTAILIDEAHVFAPEKGKGESVALQGMAALSSRGRKRGYGPVEATQRISKFAKDICAELKNAAVGLTWYEGDRDRAIDMLGVGRREREAVEKQLRHMKPGEFFVVGRAFGTIEPVKVKVGPVESTHPEPGQAKQTAAPPPPAKIRAILVKLGDLPKEAPAADRGPTAGAGRDRLAELEREIADLRVAASGFRIPQDVLDKVKIAVEVGRNAKAALLQLVDLVDGLAEDVRVAIGPGIAASSLVAATGSREHGKTVALLEEVAREKRSGGDAVLIRNRTPANDAGDGAMRMLRALAARHPTPLTEQQVSVLAGMTRKGGTYRTYRGKLTGAGYVVKDGDFLRITEAGLKAAGPVQKPATAVELLAVWRDRFTGKARDLLEYIAAQGERSVTKPDALKSIGLDPAGGTARTYWGQLSGCGLIERAPGGFRAVESLRLV